MLLRSTIGSFTGHVRTTKSGSDSVIWSDTMTFELYKFDDQWKITSSREAI